MTARLSDAAASTAADAVTALLDGGYLRIHDGWQPTTAEAQVTSQVLLAELRFGSPAFAPAIDGVAQANPITPDASARASGAPTWFRALAADSTTVVFDGAIASSGGQLTASDPWITAGSPVEVEDLQYQEPRS